MHITRQLYDTLKKQQCESLPKPGIKRKKKHSKADGSAEKHEAIQANLEQICEKHGLRYVHIPGLLLTFLYGNRFLWFLNGCFKIVGTASLAKMFYGVLQKIRREFSFYWGGWPDLVIFDKTRYLAIEIKTGNAKQRRSQKNWANDITVNVIHDYASGENLIEGWLMNEEL
jgi:hypothetical protein